MRRKTVSGIMLILLLVGMLTLAFNIQQVKAEPATIIVPDDYEKIQWAIGNASDGDTIFVKAGTYYENVVVNKTLSLIGENRSTTIIDGGYGTGFHVVSDNVNISGFSIRNCGPPEGGPFGGIRLDSSDNCRISGNTINNSYVGIWPDAGSSNFIFNNTLSKCSYAIGGPLLFSSGNNHNIFNNFISDNAFGIYLLRSSNSIVSNNTILNSRRLSIYLQYCINIILTNNNMTNNIYGLEVFGESLSHFIHNIDVSNTVDGKPVYYLINQRNLIIDSLTFPDVGYLGLVNSTNITIKNLNLTRSGQGLLLAYTTYSTVMYIDASFNSIGIDLFSSTNNAIINNTITSNRYDGITLNYDCNSNTISDNTISNNGKASILMSLSESNIIRCNTLSNSDYGIFLYSSQDNTIYHNNFIDNTHNVDRPVGPINTWDNGYPSGGNYWSDYTGVDVKSGPNQDQPSSDGIGDTAYVIDANNIDHYPLMYPWGAPPPPSYNLIIHSSPTGVTFTVDGVSCTAPWSGTYTEDTSVSLVMPSTHTVGDARYYWNQWSDGNTSRSRTVTMNTDITLTAYYTGPYYQLTVTSSPITGITFTINGNPQTTPYTEWLLSGSYTLVMPETHTVGEAKYYWDQWSDGVTSRSRTVSMDTEITLTGGFAGPYYELTVTSSPVTGIQFTINGAPKTTPYTEWLLLGFYTLVMPETHTVGEARYYWNQWSDGNTSRSRTITMNTNITLTAHYTGPYYQLTVTSSPITGIPFTIDGAPKTTPYTEWLPEGSYTLIMPETHNRYVWSRWLEDGDTNRIKTIYLQGTTWTAVYEPAPKPVGGKAVPIDKPIIKPELQVPWIWLSTIILSLVATVVYVKKRKGNTGINS